VPETGPPKWAPNALPRPPAPKGPEVDITTKHALKIAGETPHLIFWGKTRVDYERVLKRFIEFCHERGRERNADIDKRDMRDYLTQMIERGASASYIDKVKSAIVKFGALYHKCESFKATGCKVAALVRERVAACTTAGPVHQRVTPEIAQSAMERLRELDERFEIQTGLPRGYHLAAELQSRCGLRAFEATERMTSDRLVGCDVRGKGGRERDLPIPQDLLDRLRAFFAATGAACLAPLRAYETAVRRAVIAVGGRSTGTHARRRLWAADYKNERYRHYVSMGLPPAAASARALADTLEALGHGRERRELRRAYLSAA